MSLKQTHFKVERNKKFFPIRIELDVTKMENKKPKYKFSEAGVQITAWENEGKDNKPFITFNLVKAYKDKDDKWQTSSSFTLEKIAIIKKGLEALEKMK